MVRGSEWVRADFHIHTKGTNKNDQFSSSSIDEFFELFFKEAEKSQVKVIGITDYFSVDNYNKAKKKLEKIETNENFTQGEKFFFKDVLLIPNIELRMAPVTARGKLINIHCLFSPEKIDDLEEDFFNEIKCSGNKMTKRGLVNLGKTHLEDGKSDDEYYKKGIEVFVVELEDLKKIKDKFGEDVLIGVANSSGDGASGIKGHEAFYSEASGSLEEVQRQIYKIADFIFSGNPGDRKYFLGEKTSLEEVNSRCGGIKPCFHGSDAHDEEKLFKPDLDRKCWIKADLTFDGIKQIIHEPKDRVLIQNEKPEEKNDYEIIDKVSFKDQSGEIITINLNQNLNTIIGGKSTGKSLLLKNIIKFIDDRQLSEKLKEKKSVLELTNFEVFWRDGVKSREQRRIEYIPQSYLNKLVDKSDSESLIDDIVKTVLLQNETRRNIFQNVEKKLKEKEKEVFTLIESYFEIKSEMTKSKEAIKEIGIEEGIKKNRDQLVEKIENLKKESGMIDEEITAMNVLKTEIEKLNHKKQELELELERLSDLQLDVIINSTFLEKIKEFNDIEEEILKITKDTESRIRVVVNSKFNAQSLIIKDLSKEIGKKLEKLQPFNEKAKNQDELNKLETQIKVEEEKLNKIKLLVDLFELKKREIEKTRKSILEKIDDYALIYDQILISPLGECKFGEIEIKIEKLISREKWENILECVNGTNLRSYDNFQKENIPDQVELKNFFELVLDEKLKLKASFEKKEALKRITKNNYIIKYEVSERNNNLRDMSEGNKSFVLLEMLLEFNEGKYPIVIDQPEDDLDNRSIYNDLVRFIRNKKKQRQIILATHNANVVVGADAENVIVANQHGIGTENKNNVKFNYKNGSLENQSKGGNCTLNSKTIKEHICEILEGGEQAFESRRKKYNFK